MTHGIRHPFTRALYERDDTGNIRVTDGDRQGLFTDQGRWIEGDLRECDPQLCGWVAGPQVINHRMTSEPAAPAGVAAEPEHRG